MAKPKTVNVLKFDPTSSSRSLNSASLHSSTSSDQGFHSNPNTRPSVAIHPTFFIKERRKRSCKNAYSRHRLSEGDFGFRSSSPLVAKIRSIFAQAPNLLIKRTSSSTSKSSSYAPSHLNNSRTNSLTRLKNQSDYYSSVNSTMANRNPQK